MNTAKIRIRLKSFDHYILDQTLGDIISTAKRTGARVRVVLSAADIAQAYGEPWSP